MRDMRTHGRMHGSLHVSGGHRVDWELCAGAIILTAGDEVSIWRAARAIPRSRWRHRPQMIRPGAVRDLWQGVLEDQT